MRLVTLNFICVIGVLLTSCFPFTEKEQTEYIIDPPSVDLTVEKTLETDYFTIDDWPDEEWWKLFQSPQLDALMAEALENNPSIQAIEERVEAAHQLSNIAYSKLIPWISLDGSYLWDYLSKNGLFRAFNPKLPLWAKLYQLNFNLNYEVDIWGKNREYYQAALGNERSKIAENAQVVLLVTTAVAQAYITVKQYELQKELITRLIAVSKDIYELQDFLREKALADKLIALAAEQNFFDVEKALWVVEQQLELSKHQLNVLVGRSPDEPLELGQDPLPLFTSLAIPCSITSDLLARRPDLMAKIWSAEALGHDVNAAITEYYPDVNLTALVGLESVKSGLFFRGSSFTGNVLPAFHLPIFTAGEIQANIDDNIAMFYESIFEYNQLLLRSAQEVTDNLEIALSLFKQKEEQAQLLKRLKERVDLTQLLYKKGLGDQLSNYYVIAELVNQEIVDLDLTYNLYQAVVQLIKSLGGGYESLYVPLGALEVCTND